MKIRKHKNNKLFLITFANRPPGRTETHLNSDGTSRKVVTEGEFPFQLRRVWRAGLCKQSVLKAFLTGLDAGNMTTTIREATPLV